MLSHPEWQNKASCATCVRESKRKQYVPCPTYSDMAISLRRKQRVDSFVNIASKYYNSLVTAIGLKGIKTLSRMNACSCKLSMSRIYIYYTYKVMFTRTLNLLEAIWTKEGQRMPSSHGVMAVICPPTESCSRYTCTMLAPGNGCRHFPAENGLYYASIT